MTDAPKYTLVPTHIHKASGEKVVVRRVERRGEEWHPPGAKTTLIAGTGGDQIKHVEQEEVFVGDAIVHNILSPTWWQPPGYTYGTYPKPGPEWIVPEMLFDDWYAPIATDAVI